MINPILYIVAGAVFLSALVICIINKPRKPVMTGALIALLMCFIVITFLVDNAISNLDTSGSYNHLVDFFAGSEDLSVRQLESTFYVLFYTDIALIGLSLVSLTTEIVIILRRENKK